MNSLGETIMKKQSPCLECERKDDDKTLCAKRCQRLIAYVNGELYDDIPIPDLKPQDREKQDVIMCKKCGEKPATLTSAGQAINGLCDYCQSKTMLEAKRKKSLMKKTGEKSDKRARPGEKNGCEYPDCDRPYKARGLCSMHHGKWIRGKLSDWPKYNVIMPSRRPKKNKMKLRGRVVETIPESQITVDLSRYPKLRDLVFSTALRLYVTPEHVIISMIARAVAARPEAYGAM